MYDFDEKIISFSPAKLVYSLNNFRLKDVNRPKAVVAAEFINNRVKGCNVIPYLLSIIVPF